MPETQTVLSEAPRIHRCAKHPNLIQHRELSDAFAAVARARTQRGIELHVYSCRDCGFYHLSRNDRSDSIGPEVMALPVYTTETPAPDSVVRDIFSDRERVTFALRDLGEPNTVRARDIAARANMPRDRVTETLQKMGWERTGATKAVRWNRPGVTPDTPESFIRETLDASGGSVAASEIIAAGIARGFTEGEITYARARLRDPRIRTYRSLGGRWFWGNETPMLKPTPKPHPPQKQPERLPLGSIEDLTLDQIRRAAEAFGISIEIEITTWDRKGPGQ